MSRCRTKKVRINLIEESEDTRVFATKRYVGKKVFKKYHIVLKREPQFTVERSVEEDGQFIRLTKNNQLVGLIRDGHLERHGEIPKLFFLGKLDLKPNINNKESSELAESIQTCSSNDQSLSAPDDETQSWQSFSSPPTHSD